jgi:Holliday junction resolvase RusA-like endonuclease
MLHGDGVDLKIPGPPTGKGRPTFVRATGRAVTPAKTRIAENRIYLAWQDAGQPRLPDGPLELHVELVLTRPQGHWTAAGDLSAAGRRKQWPTKKPDFDNAVKLVADSLNGCAYRDDAQIVRAEIVKRWAHPGESEHTRVTLWVIHETELRAVA